MRLLAHGDDEHEGERRDVREAQPEHVEDRGSILHVVGAAGVAVRNLFGYRLFAWDDVCGVSFPTGARWARLDLPDDEYVPVMAIQTVDKLRAVHAMDRVRELEQRYRPDLASRHDPH